MATADDIVDELKKIVDEVSGFTDAMDSVADLQANYLGDVIGEATKAITTMHEEIAGHFTQLGERIRQGFDSMPKGGVPRGAQQPVERPGMIGRWASQFTPANLASRGMTMLGAMIGRITGVLAPLALFANALQSTTSGFQPFLSTVKLLGVVMGGLLLPAMVVLTGALFALAMLINNEISPVLEIFYRDVIGSLSDSFDLLTEAAGGVADGLKDLGVTTKDLAEFFGGFLSSVSGSNIKKGADKNDFSVRDFTHGATRGMFGGVGSSNPGTEVGDRMTRELLQKVNEKMGGGTAREINERELARRREERQGSVSQLMREGRELAAQEMRRSLGGQGGFTGLAAAQREAITAGLNFSPFERKMLEIQLHQLETLERILGESSKIEPTPTR